jgi:hypothetical protein
MIVRTLPFFTAFVRAVATLAFASLGLISCGSDNGPRPDSPAPKSPTVDSGGSGGSPSSDGSTIPILSTDVAIGPADDSSAHPGGTLPPPWQYASDGGVHAYKDPALPADVIDQFGGPPDTSAANKPVIVYPLARSMHPMNLGLITFQFTQGSATSSVFRIEVKSGNDTFDLFVPCTDPSGHCAYAMPESEWLDLGTRQAGKDVTFTIAGTDGKGGAVATSDPLTLSFSPEPVLGGLYYWASSAGTIKRATFGSSQAVDYIKPGVTPGFEGYACVACHSVSRDGKTTAFAVTSPSHLSTTSQTTDAPWAIFVLPTTDITKPYVKPTVDAAGVNTSSFGSFPALSSDGTLMAVAGSTPPDGGLPIYLEIRDARTGASLDKKVLSDHTAFGASWDMAILPEWSPDGKYLAVTLLAIGDWKCFWDHLTCIGTVALMPWDNVAKKLGPAMPLVQSSTATAGANHFYPTWSPDGKWIAFVSGRPPPTKNDYAQKSYDAKDGVLRMVPSDPSGGPYTCPGPKCIELANATRYSWDDAVADKGFGSTLPKFTPFAQGPNKDLFFITYTSRIDYGFTSDPANLRQLWMSAIDMSETTGDPSHVPFWVPYQILTEKNVQPYWTEILACAKDPSGGCQGCVGGEQCKVDALNNCFCEAEINVK